MSDAGERRPDGDTEARPDGDAEERPEATDSKAAEEPADETGRPDDIVTIRTALVGLGFLWLTAVAAAVTLLSSVYGVLSSGWYLVAAVTAAGVAVTAGRRTVRTFKSG